MCKIESISFGDSSDDMHQVNNMKVGKLNFLLPHFGFFQYSHTILLMDITIRFESRSIRPKQYIEEDQFL
jgi:hypothetical protein